MAIELHAPVPEVVDLVNGVSRMLDREVASELAARLGLKYLAVLGGTNETRVARRWTEENGTTPRQADNLRAALQAARAIAFAFGDAGARSWFGSTNAMLGFRAPIVLLREARSEDERSRVVAAAAQEVA